MDIVYFPPDFLKMYQVDTIREWKFLKKLFFIRDDDFALKIFLI